MDGPFLVYVAPAKANAKQLTQKEKNHIEERTSGKFRVTATTWLGSSSYNDEDRRATKLTKELTSTGLMQQQSNYSGRGERFI